MTALLCRPIPFTASTTGTYPQSNANVDHPALIARGTSITATFPSQVIDTIAIIGNQTGTVTISGGYAGSMAAVTGTKAAGVTSKTIFTFTPRAATTITVTFSSSADVQRLIIGRSVSTAGIDADTEQSFDDPSIAYGGNGWESFDYYPVRPSWKFRFSWIGNTQWRNEFFPLFTSVGASRGVLFVPTVEDASTHAHEATFGRLTGVGKGQHNNYDNWVIEGIVTGFTA